MLQPPATLELGPKNRNAVAMPKKLETAPGARRDHWQGPLSVQTTPQGQPEPPGAQLAKVAQLAQLPFEQVQLWPLLETLIPWI
jgi:hypothetical protein